MRCESYRPRVKRPEGSFYQSREPAPTFGLKRIYYSLIPELWKPWSTKPLAVVNNGYPDEPLNGKLCLYRAPCYHVVVDGWQFYRVRYYTMDAVVHIPNTCLLRHDMLELMQSMSLAQQDALYEWKREEAILSQRVAGLSGLSNAEFLIQLIDSSLREDLKYHKELMQTDLQPRVWRNIRAYVLSWARANCSMYQDVKHILMGP